MKSVFLALVAACMTVNSTCTTLQPTEATPAVLQHLILSEGILKLDQRVRLVTSDETVNEFRVAGIDGHGGVVHGKNEAVAIEEILAVETREISASKTAPLTGGFVYGIGMIIAIAIAPAAILGGP